MTKENSPWMKFYPQDWRSDEKLRLCSLGARGLWIEMLAIMHRSERYGHLLVNGHVPNDAQLAVLAGAPAEQVTNYLGELEQAGVFSRNAIGVIYSRRMTRDQKKVILARKNGKTGGNPSLSKQRENKPPDKGSVKGVVKDSLKLRSHMLDIIYNPPNPPGGLLRQIFAEVGIDETKIVNPGWHVAQSQILADWEKSGIDLEAVALPEIRRIVERKRASDPNWSPGSLAYFDAAVRRKIGDQSIIGPGELLPVKDGWTVENWEIYFQNRTKKPRPWNAKLMGPPPGDPKTLVPESLRDAAEAALKDVM